MRSRPTKRLAVACCTLLLACAGGEPDEEAAPPAAAPAAAAPAGLSLADVAGRWSMETMPENADTTLLTYELTATADGQGWTMTFPDRAEPIPLQVLSVAGDSVVTQAGPFESALRAGVTVTSTSVMRLVNGQLIGMTTARYATSSADSVIVLRQRGTRIQ